MKIFAFLLMLLVLPSCATIFEGTSQELSITTNPEGADCALMRDGQMIGRINPTPGNVIVTRTKDDITVVCNKDGYAQAIFFNNSGNTIAPTSTNIVLGGGFGWAIDSATGADNKYTTPMNINLNKK